MPALPRILLTAAFVMAAPFVHAQMKESKIVDQLKSLRAVAPDQKGAAILKIAGDINTQPAGLQKVKLADNLVHLVTEGDPGPEPLQTAADTLAKALTESPVAPKKDEIPMPYMDLAKLARYEGAQLKMDDPLYAKASQRLVDEEAEIQKVDFTLRDLKGKKVTLSELHGKIVMVNFWATWCAPCRLEMGDLDVIYNYFQSQGLVVLSITDEDLLKVGQYFTSGATYRPTVLFDPDQKVHKEFHVDGIPRTYLFGRDGKLLAVAIDQRTRRQFLQMLEKTDLHP
jgi:peroxiredoxin